VTTKERPGKVEVDLAADVLFAVDKSVLSPVRANPSWLPTTAHRRDAG